VFRWLRFCTKFRVTLAARYVAQVILRVYLLAGPRQFDYKQRLLAPVHVECNILHHNCTQKRLPEDEPSGSKHVDDIIQIKIVV